MKKILLLSLLILLTISCRKPGKKNQATNTLKLAISGEIPTLDPANSYDTLSGGVLYQCYETLYQYHYLKRPYTVIPLLAKGMPKVENNGKRYIIKIKKNVAFHNDSSFNGKKRFLKAQDFITQLKRIAFIPTNSNGVWLFIDKVKGFKDFREKVGSNFELFEKTNISGLTTPNDHTLVIDLYEPYPQMLFALAMTFTTPIPIEVVKKYKNNLAENIVGTGPFQLASWRRSAYLELKKFSDYRNELYPSQGDRTANTTNLLKDAGQKLPFIENIKMSIIKESQARWLLFLNKQLDVLNLTKDNFKSATSNGGVLDDKLTKMNVKLKITPSLTYWWIAFNMKDPVLGENKYLRLAFAHAIDFAKYVKLFTNNTGLRAHSIYPPGIPGYNPARRAPYDFDIEKAKKYLELAGYPEGKGLPELRFDLRNESSEARQELEFFTQSFRNVGIKVKGNLNTFPAFLKKSRAGNLQIWIGGWAMDYPDAENSLQLLTTSNHPPYGPNNSFYSNKQFDEYFERLKIINNGPEKTELMTKMEDIVMNDLPWIMIHYSRSYTVNHEYINNFRPSDIVYNYLKYLKISPH